jgi:membrane-bound serine protease (ClpP class)
VSYGVLAIGGIISMALGSLLLYEETQLGFRISWGVILPTVGVTAGLFLGVLTIGVRALRRRPMLGAAGLVGQGGIARETLAPDGQVAVQGEIWRAVAQDPPVEAGAAVRVVAVEGLTLKVVKDGGGGGTR